MRVLDLFCGAGGAAMGLHRAWPDAEIIGVDIKPQPRYPFTFVQDDCSKGWPDFPEQFDFIWASPPCQRHTCLRSVFDSSKYGCHIKDIRERLITHGIPWVIENVVGAPIRTDLTLCAAYFGLRSYRHRVFECSFPVEQPEHLKHLVAVNRRGKNRREHWDSGGYMTITGDVGSYLGPEAMGIDWMTGNELSQAIPPAYSEYIARQWGRTPLAPPQASGSGETEGE